MEAAVKSLYDFKQVVLPEKMLQVQVSREMLEDKMASMALQFAVIEAVDEGIRNGDIVAVEVPGEEETQVLHINVGKGFWGKELEESLLGRKPGAEGKDFKVLTVKRRILPERNDALAVRFGIPGVATIQDWEKYAFGVCADRLKQGKIQPVFKVAMREVMQKSVFENVETDVQSVYESYLTQAQQMMRPGKDLKEVLEGFVNKTAENLEQAQDNLRKECEEQVKMACIGKAFAQQAGAALSREDAVNMLSGRMPADQIDDVAIQMVMLQHYARYCFQVMSEYYMTQFQASMA